MVNHERERIGLLIFYGLVILLAYMTFQLFRPFLVPLAWAGVLVVCFHPVHEAFEERWGRTRAAALSTLSVTVIVILPMLLVVSSFVSEAARSLGNVPGLLGRAQEALDSPAWQAIRARVPGAESVDVPALVTSAAQEITAFLTAQGAAVIQNLVVFVVYLGITIFAMFFIFRDRAVIMRGIRGVLPLDEDLRERMIAQTGTLVTASVVSSLIVAAVQGILGGIAFWALGLGAPVFWAVVMAFFCLLPFGAWVVWGPTAIWLLATGDVTRAIVLAAVGAGVVSAVDNFLRPILLSGRSEMNGLLLLISLLGGVAAFGGLGLVLGPIVMATSISLLDAHLAGRRSSRDPDVTSSS